MYKIRLAKIRSIHDNVRTDEIEGVAESLPILDQSFVMYGNGLEFGTRIIQTTKVNDIIYLSTLDGKKLIEFTTTNSQYYLEVLCEMDIYKKELVSN